MRIQVLVFFLPLLSGCYTVRQGTTYLALLSKAAPVVKLADDPDLPQAKRELIERAARIRAFAIGELGLKDTKNYTTLIDLDSDRVATVVQACAELSFDRYLWNYPVVGRLPYKGFFDPADAEKERERLKAIGYDVIVRGVDSFSTLGWFSDPLYTFMAKYDEAELAELLIHEMTHATAFSKAPGSFNEELATFVGRRGAQAWLEKREGRESAALVTLLAKRRDGDVFAAFLAETASELDAMYRSDISAEDKRREKERIIAARADSYREKVVPTASAKAYKNFPMDKINNAFIDLYTLYEGEGPLYGDYLTLVCGGDIRRFIAASAAAAKAKDPKAALRAALPPNSN